MATITDARPHPARRVGHAAPRAGAVAGVPRRAAGHPAARAGRHGRPGAGADRRAADHRRRAARAGRARPRRGCATAVLLAAVAVRGHRVRGLPAQRPAVPDDRERRWPRCGCARSGTCTTCRCCTQNAERRGSLVSRVTSDVDTISTFMQWGGLLMVVSFGQLLVATVADGRLLVAAHAAGLALLPAAVPADAAPSRSGSPAAYGAGARAGRRPARRGLRVAWSAPRRSGPTAIEERTGAAHRRARSSGTGRPRRGRRRWSR